MTRTKVQEMMNSKEYRETMEAITHEMRKKCPEKFKVTTIKEG